MNSKIKNTKSLDQQLKNIEVQKKALKKIVDVLSKKNNNIKK